MSTTETAPLDQSKLDAFVGRFLGDLGTALHMPTVLVGDRLGLYRAMADGKSTSPAELAERTGTNERYVGEWLAAGYVEYDDAVGTFRLPPEHAALLIDQGAPVFIPGAFQLAASTVKDEPLITEAFRTGEGVAWHAHHPDLFVGCERFFRPGYAAHLIDEWLPALEGRRSSGSTTTTPRSRPPGGPPTRPAWVSALASTSPPHRITRVRTTTSWPSSTACTTWVTRLAPPVTSGRPWPPTGRG